MITLDRFIAMKDAEWRFVSLLQMIKNKFFNTWRKHIPKLGLKGNTMIRLKNILEVKDIDVRSNEIWHYDNKINITENIFREHRVKLVSDLIVEARKMFDKSGHAWFEGRDKELFETTDIGRFAYI
jgi:hypothetical protein